MHKLYLIFPNVCRLAPQSRLIAQSNAINRSGLQFPTYRMRNLAPRIILCSHIHTPLSAQGEGSNSHILVVTTDHSPVTSPGVVGLANSCLYQPSAVRVLILFYHITFISNLLFACNILIEILILFLSKYILINLLGIILYLFPTRLM